jgi:pimeloyl-ACP methyl ester carboxylesterase
LKAFVALNTVPPWPACVLPSRCSPGRRRVPFVVPTLLLVGERDAAIPTRAVREQAARAGALELELVPEAGHFIADEKPELVAGRTLAFFRP